MRDGLKGQGGAGVPAVFLDRDGTLNVEKEYVFRYEDWEWIPGAVEGLKELGKMGFKLVVVSNQSGVARGYYARADMEELHRRVGEDLKSQGVTIAGFYYCPHGPGEGCACRKPEPGMILHAAKDLDIDLSRSFMVGDKAIDVEAGRRAGVRTFLVETGYGREESRQVATGVPRVKNLFEAVEAIRSLSHPLARPFGPPSPSRERES